MDFNQKASKAEENFKVAFLPCQFVKFNPNFKILLLNDKWPLWPLWPKNVLNRSQQNRYGDNNSRKSWAYEAAQLMGSLKISSKLDNYSRMETL